MNSGILANVVAFVSAQVICFAAAAVGGYFTSTSVRTWYQEISKPAWNPPEWLFGPVWTVLFAMMGVALWLVWRAAGWQDARWALIVFGIQLVLNATWSGLFFGARNPGLAFAEVLLLWCAIVASITAFWPHSRVAAALLIPYLAWSTFAVCLNFAIWRLN